MPTLRHLKLSEAYINKERPVNWFTGSGNSWKLSNYVCARRKIASYLRNRPENYWHKSNGRARAPARGELDFPFAIFYLRVIFDLFSRVMKAYVTVWRTGDPVAFHYEKCYAFRSGSRIINEVAA